MRCLHEREGVEWGSVDAHERTAWVLEQAAREGFDLCGVARAEAFPELAHLPEWLERGYSGQMQYLHDERRRAPGRVLEGARSVIVCAASYKTPEPVSTEWMARPIDPAEAPRGWISRYAWGTDYHDVLLPRLQRLARALEQQFGPEVRTRAYVDTGPIVERVAAKYAGLGWLGKNTCLIHPRLGSWLFLGTILTTLELAPTCPPEQPPPDLCGSCRRCLDACPTGALVAPYVMDARRCIAYLTIEHRGPIPEEFRPAIGPMVFGCDICQDVCPWNRKAPARGWPEFAPRRLTEFPADGQQPETLLAPALEWLAALSEEDYRQVFRRSPVKRAKYRGLLRNVCIALGNAARAAAPGVRQRVARLLERLAASDDPLIAEHARWALGELEPPRRAEATAPAESEAARPGAALTGGRGSLGSV